MPPLPERPDVLAAEAVLAYVEAYERAYQWRRWADDGESVREIGVSMSPEVYLMGDDAVIVEVAFAQAAGRVDTDGDGEPDSFDGPPYSFSYLVTRDAVWRAERDRRENVPDPVEDGVLVECHGGTGDG